MTKHCCLLTRHPELVSGSIYQPQPLVCAEAWMLKQVQHDEIGKRVHL